MSVGADPHRDYELLLEVARSLPSVSFSIVMSGDGARGLADVPTNVAVEVDIPFEHMRSRLDEARVIAVPVRENTYSGATTVLLQRWRWGSPWS